MKALGEQAVTCNRDGREEYLRKKKQRETPKDIKGKCANFFSV